MARRGGVLLLRWSAVMLLTLAMHVRAQEAHADSSRVAPDTVTAAPSRPDTIRYLPPSDLRLLPPLDDSSTVRGRNPQTALFHSLLLPGWGQIENRAYVKAALYGGAELYFLSRAIHFAREAADRRNAWNAATGVSERNSAYDAYLKSADARNAHRWYFGITTVISMFDAYVDAHLAGRPRARRAVHSAQREAALLHVQGSAGSFQLALRW